MWVRSWSEVPEDVGLLGELGRGEHAGGVGRQVELQDLGGAARDAAQALGLAVAEDRAEVRRRALVAGERLREEHRALRVVAVGEVDEVDREELGVVVAGGLDLGDELGPGDADDQRLEAGVGGGVLLVHREDGEVLDPVLADLLGTEGLDRAQEVGLAEVLGDPVAQVDAERGDVVGLVGEVRAEGLGGGRRSSRPARRGGRLSCSSRSTEPSLPWVRRSSATASRSAVQAGSAAAADSTAAAGLRKTGSAAQ